jgi:hypothetical protein
MKGFSGKILHVDLTKGALTVETPPESFYRQYVGGACMGVYCKGEFPIVAKKIPQALGGEFWLPPHERVPHSVALSVEDQQVAMVHEPVDQSRGHGLVEEDVHPPAELQVRGDEHAALLVAS